VIRCSLRVQFIVTFLPAHLAAAHESLRDTVIFIVLSCFFCICWFFTRALAINFISCFEFVG
jgi:hypothetical protein